MGTTLDALLAGSTRFQYVVAIEGYKYLLTNGSTAAALTAWAATDWTLALDGLSVDFKQAQSLDPSNGFPTPPGITFAVKADVPFTQGDRFGVDTHRKVGGSETQLTATAYPCPGDAVTADTAQRVYVQSTGTFATSGEAHIGCECFAYTGVSSSQFTGVTRGRYSPFSAADQFSGFKRFARMHRVGADDGLNVQLKPIVTSLPRMWTGRRVGVWMHRVVGGVLDTKAQAQLVFAGRIGGIADDPRTLAITVQCDNILSELNDAVIGSDLWNGILDGEGTQLSAGMKFTFEDTIGGVATATASDFLVVASGAIGPAGSFSDNKIDAGVYTITEIAGALSIWLSNAALNGSYSIASPASSPEGQRTKIYWSLHSLSLGAYCNWKFSFPPTVADAFGLLDGATNAFGNRVISVVGQGTGEHYYQHTPPNSQLIATDGGPGATCTYRTVSGLLLDNYATLPVNIKNSLAGEWGVFIVNDDKFVTAFIDRANSRLLYIQHVFQGAVIDVSPITRSLDDASPISIRQVLAFESSFSTLFLGLAASTRAINYGSLASFNTSIDHYQSGAGIPFELLNGVVDTMDGMPGADRPVTLLLEKPTKFSEALRSDFALRWAFLYWQNGSIRMGAWRSPTNEDSVASLTEDTKAESAGSGQSQVSPTLSDAQWLRNVIKIQYARDALQLTKSDAFTKTVSFVDNVSVDEHGAAVNTLSLRNTYDQFAASGASVEALLPGFMALMPLVSREAQQISRSIDPRYFWSLGIGDIVTLSDGFARDPVTGKRRISNRAALVIAHNFWIGGFTADGQIAKMGGEVKLLITADDQDRTGVAYVPSADVLETINTGGFSGGYNSATSTLWCYTNNYSAATSTDLASFATGDKILIIEIDPIDPDAPLSWTTTVVSAAVTQLVIADALTGWDSTRTYHVLYQDYSAATTAQRTKTYQADSTDGIIIDIDLPYLYAAGAPDVTAPDNSTTPDNVALIPRSRSVDGSARDVAHETDLAYALDHFIDYKSTQRSGFLFPQVEQHTDLTNPITAVSVTSSYKLVAVWPIFLSLEILSSNVFRSIFVSPLVWSTDGTSTKARVTLTRLPPTAVNNFDTIPSSITGANQAYGYAEWTGITSTTPYQPTPAPVLCTNKHPFTGMAWVCLELGYKCATRGIAQFHEGPRQ
jgi:hypothetical protein